MIPELGEIWMGPPPGESGKFGAPCERMQSANLIPGATPAVLDPLLGFGEDPQAASAIAQAMAAGASARKRARSRCPVCRELFVTYSYSSEPGCTRAEVTRA